MPDHEFTNTRRSMDVRVESKTKDEIIKILYERLRESDEALREIQQIVGSSHRTKDITDFNSEILNPLYSELED